MMLPANPVRIDVGFLRILVEVGNDEVWLLRDPLGVERKTTRNFDVVQIHVKVHICAHQVFLE